MCVVRLRGDSSRMLGMDGRRYTFWRSGRRDVVRFTVKDKLCEKVVNVRRVMEWWHL